MILLKVKQIAQEKGIGIHKLSRLSDIGIKTVRKVYHNPAEIITTETLDKLATALEVSVCDLIEQVPNPQQAMKRNEEP